MSRTRKCIMCGGTDHHKQDGDECLSEELSTHKEYSERSKKGWMTRRMKKQPADLDEYPPIHITPDNA